MKSTDVFRNVGVYAQADHTNKEGFKSFSGALEERYVQCLLTNTASNTFYASKEELAKDALDLHKQMLAKDPEFLAKAIVYARNDGFMKLQPVLGLLGLSTLKDKKLSGTVFKDVCLIPTDVEKLIDLARSKTLRKGLGSHLKSMIRHYLKHKMCEYYAIKYKKQLKDSIRLSRPALEIFDENQANIARYIMDSECNLTSLKQISALEEMKKASDETRIVQLIKEARLPVEAVIGALKKTTPAIWEALIRSMPYMRLLRMLATLDKNGIFNKQENVDYVVQRLTDEKQIAYAKILPFRFYAAYMTATGLPLKVKDALNDALELSFINMPELKGDTMIAMDQSGSMGSSLTGSETIACKDIVGIFAAAMLRKNPETVKHIIGFESNAYPMSMSSRDSIMTNARKSQANGGTFMEAPIKYMLDKSIKVDNMIYFTDNEEWGEGMYTWLQTYRKRINPNVKCFFVTLTPYGDKVAPNSDPNCHYIYGWNDKVLNYISLMSEGLGSQVETIRKVKLDANTEKRNERESED